MRGASWKRSAAGRNAPGSTIAPSVSIIRTSTSACRPVDADRSGSIISAYRTNTRAGWPISGGNTRSSVGGTQPCSVSQPVSPACNW